MSKLSKKTSTPALPKLVIKQTATHPDPKKKVAASSSGADKLSKTSHDSPSDSKSKSITSRSTKSSTTASTSHLSKAPHSSSPHSPSTPHSTNASSTSSLHRTSGTSSHSSSSSHLHSSSSSSHAAEKSADKPSTSTHHPTSTPAPAPAPAAPPKNWKMVDGVLTFTSKPTLNDFELHQIIGSGTFGVVQVAKHKESGTYVALKILNKQRICDLRQAEHMKYEREVLIRCQHPRIVRLYESMQDEDNLYLIMELCLGGDFFTLRQEHNTFQPSVVRYYAAQLVTVMEHLHQQHIAYRDLKPENILLDSKGQLKLTDFGFAKEIDDLSFTLCGTAEYIAPELVLGTGHDMGVDWWAMGILLYEMLVGNPPFYGNLTETYEAIIRYKPPTKGIFDPQEEDTEEEANLRALAKDLIIELLRKDRRKRLGCLFGGVEDVKNNPFFAGIDWEAMKNGTLPAPIEPTPVLPQNLEAIEPEPNEPVEPPSTPGPESDPANFVDF